MVNDQTPSMESLSTHPAREGTNRTAISKTLAQEALSKWLIIVKFELIQNSDRFGSNAARGGGVDLRLTSLNDVCLERMLEARKGTIGDACEFETKKMGEEYAGPHEETIKTSVSSNSATSWQIFF